MGVEGRGGGEAGRRRPLARTLGCLVVRGLARRRPRTEPPPHPWAGWTMRDGGGGQSSLASAHPARAAPRTLPVLAPSSSRPPLGVAITVGWATGEERSVRTSRPAGLRCRGVGAGPRPDRVGSISTGPRRAVEHGREVANVDRTPPSRTRAGAVERGG